MVLFNNIICDRDVGRQATQLILEEAHKIGEGLEPGARARINALTSAIQRDLGKKI